MASVYRTVFENDCLINGWGYRVTSNYVNARLQLKHWKSQRWKTIKEMPYAEWKAYRSEFADTVTLSFDDLIDDKWEEVDADV